MVSGAGAISGLELTSLQSELNLALESNPPFIVLDLSQVPLMDGVGLEYLLDVRESAEQRGGDLKLAGPTPLCHDILFATRLDRTFQIFDDTRRAIGSFVR